MFEVIARLCVGVASVNAVRSSPGEQVAVDMAIYRIVSRNFTNAETSRRESLIVWETKGALEISKNIFYDGERNSCI